jgi:hypothetical protein
MTEKLVAGQNVRFTIVREVLRQDDVDTVLRLMRQDPAARRGLKHAQEHRVRTLIIRSRGKRPWEQREKSSKLVRAVKGATWTMRWFPHIAPDVNAVARYLDVKPA